MRIENLGWDTQFFGLRVGRISPTKKVEVSPILNLAKKNGIRLLYLFLNSQKDEDLITELEHTNIFPVTTKVTFRKSASNEVISYGQNSEIHLSNNKSRLKKNYKKDLYELAYISGHKSRFNLDQNIAKEKFREMYRAWVDNTLGNSQGYVIAAFCEDSIAGMSTIHYGSGDHSTVGLIGVDPIYQGRSIGKSLMLAMEGDTYRKGLRHIHVATQKENTKACRFYNNLGYSSIEETMIFHIWL